MAASTCNSGHSRREHVNSRVGRRYQMKTPTINPDEMLKSMAAEAVKQHKQIRTTIRDLTLEALQMRELSLKQINNGVRKDTESINLGFGARKTHREKAVSNPLR